MTANCRLSSVAALLMACGGVTRPQADELGNRASTEVEADTPACVEGTSTSGWVGGDFARSSGVFSVELDATPGATDEDALVGLAHATPGAYSDLAAIVRFNADGKIDARDGDTYHAFEDISYRAGQKYHLLFNIDTVNHKYTARDVIEDSGYDIARDFSFRTEQANVADLGSYGVKVDAGGPLDVCNVIAKNGTCMSADAGQGFVNFGFAPQSTFVTIAFDATPSAANVDVVMGVSSLAATSFNDIAAAVRFNADGKIDARDGDVYREVPGLEPYVGGTSHHFVLIIDVLSHTYAVAVDYGYPLNNLAFRTQQAHVGSLGNLVLASDGDTGAVARCAVGISPPRDAAYVHDANITGPVSVALPDGRYLNVQSGQTLVFDGMGAPAGTAPVTGSLAVDAAGNLYRTGTFWGTYDTGAGTLTSAGGVDAFLVKYDAAFNPVWSARYGGSADDTVSAPVVNANGDVLMVLDDRLAHVDPQGNLVYQNLVFNNGVKFALAPDGSLYTNDDPPTYRALSITKRDPSGNFVWTHSMPIVEGGVSLLGLAADATGGVVFAGEIDGKLDLGGGHTLTLEPQEDGAQTYVAKLDPDGAYVYARWLDISDFEGLVVDALGNAAVSGEHENGFFARINEFDASGNLFRVISGDTLIPHGSISFSGMPVIADWAGHLYWSFTPGPAGYESYFVKVSAP